MEQIRRWFYRPKKDDKSLLAQFFYADESLNMIANELDSFDGRKDPERCTSLVNQLRQSQDKVLTITNAIMDVLIGDERANRDFRVKFPEDVLQENLAGQLWFGAECLAAGSSIMNREAESTAMRPLAKAVTKSLENVRNLLRNTCLRNNTPNGPIKLDSNELFTEMLLESLKIFDKLFANFELAYVSAMVPVKSIQEYELQELICVHFSETLQRALKMKLLTQDMVDDCDPALMFTIPRLAIVSGLFIYPDGPLCVDKPAEEMSEMFKPFRTLLRKIRELLWTLNKRELYRLEKLLCDNEQIFDVRSLSADADEYSELDEFIGQFYDYPFCYKGITKTINASDGSKEEDNVKKADKNIMCCDKSAEVEVKKSNNVDDEGTSSNNNSNNKLNGGNNVVLKEFVNGEESASGIDVPSTSSGYLIPNTVSHDKIVASLRDTPEPAMLDRVETPPERDSLEVISVAAATLSSILTNETVTQPTIESKPDPESPNDSGICTETTSLDRSPSLDLNETAGKSCNCETKVPVISCQCYTESKGSSKSSSKSNRNSTSPKDRGKKVASPHKEKAPTGTNRTYSKNVVPVRKKTKLLKVVEGENDEEDATSVTSSDTTSSYNSNCVDDEEIFMAWQAAEIACRNDIRSKYSSSEDLIHRLFVCIAGVADQLQTNFAADLRNILKAVFLTNASDTNVNTQSQPEPPPSLETSIEYHPTENEVIENNEFSVDPNILAQEALFDTNVYFHLGSEVSETNGYTNHPRQNQDDDITSITSDFNRFTSLREDVVNLNQPSSIETHSNGTVRTPPRQEMFEKPPVWIPDIEAPKCMSCGANFTVVKRRHHCRNCGKVFCSRCSSNSVPLPKFGLNKPVRVCNKCFIYNLTPFTM